MLQQLVQHEDAELHEVEVQSSAEDAQDVRDGARHEATRVRRHGRRPRLLQADARGVHGAELAEAAREAQVHGADDDACVGDLREVAAREQHAQQLGR